MQLAGLINELSCVAASEEGGTLLDKEGKGRRKKQNFPVKKPKFFNMLVIESYESVSFCFLF